MEKPLCLSVKEAAEVLGLPEKGVYHAIAKGHLPSVRIGGRILVPRAKLEALIGGEPASPCR